MRTNMTQKTFSCSNCEVDFQITIEPQMSENEMEEKYPVYLKSVEWLNFEVKNCPVCGYSLIEEEEV